ISLVSASPGGVAAAASVRWSLGSLAANTTGSVQFVLRVPDVPGGPFACGGAASASAVADVSDACGVYAGTLGAGAPASLDFHNAVVALTQNASAATVPQGLPVTFMITAMNSCDDSAVNVAIWD